MSYEQPLFRVGEFMSDTDRSNITTYQYAAVAIGVAQNIVGSGQGNAALVAPTAGGAIMGVLQNAPFKGQAGELYTAGITKWRASGSFTVGDSLVVDANGYCQKGSGTVVGIALEQAVAGDITTVLLK